MHLKGTVSHSTSNNNKQKSADSYKKCGFSLNTELFVAGLPESLQQSFILWKLLDFSLPAHTITFVQLPEDELLVIFWIFIFASIIRLKQI